MENKRKIIKELEKLYKGTSLGISALVYRTTDDGGECVDVMVPNLTRPWLTVNVTADSGVAMIYDVANAIMRHL